MIGSQEYQASRGPADSSGIRGYLVGLAPSLEKRRIPLSAFPLPIGREEAGSGLFIDDDRVSRLHCQITEQDGVLYIEDLESRNGVAVNGLGCYRRALFHGDVIDLSGEGGGYFRFEGADAGGGWRRSILPAQPDWKIGREPGNEIVLDDVLVSLVHARIERIRNGRLRIHDNGSLNGTTIKGRHVKTALLTPKCHTLIGSFEFKVELRPDGALQVDLRRLGESIRVECTNLTIGSGKKFRLKDVTLALRPGEFVGILGPSGAGKSTLLKALNGAEPATGGAVYFNEAPLYPLYEVFNKQIGYVPQDDIVYPDLTVKESLLYAARLRLPPDFLGFELRKIVTETIELLGISHVQNKAVKQLSGGQRKRVCIGCEMIMNPGIFFLDEPTAGLDPATEERLMMKFRELSDQGVTCLMTTHILYKLHLFDRVIIMAKGQLVFFGTPSEALVFFGGEKPLENTLKIFDLLEGVIDESGAPHGEVASGAELMEIASLYSNRYKQSVLYANHIESGLSERAQQSLQGKKFTGSTGIFDWLSDLFSFVDIYQLLVLTWRNWTLLQRAHSKIMLSLIVPLILGFATILPPPPEVPSYQDKEAEISRVQNELEKDYFTRPTFEEILEVDGNVPEEIYAMRYETLADFSIPVTTLLMMVMSPIFMGTLTTCLDISGERTIFRRERLLGQKVTDYILAKVPIIILLSVLMSAVYLGVCLIRPELQRLDFRFVVLTTVMLTFTSGCLGLAISSLDKSFGRNSVMYAILAIFPQLVLSGGLAPVFLEGLGIGWQLVALGIPSRWGMEMMLNAAYSPTTWQATLAEEEMGFEMAEGVVERGAGALLMLAASFLMIAMLAVRSSDVRRPG